jgi:hypothetical protein
MPSTDELGPDLATSVEKLRAERDHYKKYAEDLSAQLHRFGPPDYDADYLRVYNKQLDFKGDPRFRAAYDLGVNSGHTIGRGGDIGIEYRIHVLTWAGQHAARLPGDFVECGVNTGIFSLSVMQYTNFDSLGKRFYLFDTFAGIPAEQLSDEERAQAHREQHDFYFDCFELAKRNFSRFESAVLVRGAVPGTLSSVEIGPVAYLSIDMNIEHPEIAALEYFWPKLVLGGVVVLDDYAWRQHAYRKHTMDAFAARQGIEILTLPTGQGLIVKS